VPAPGVKRVFLAGAAAAGAQALDLASLGRRHVVRTAAHLAHEPLLLHLAPELPESLFELLRILDHDSHSRKRIPDGGSGRAEGYPTAGSGSVRLEACSVGSSR